MKPLLQIVVVGALALCVILMIALGMARNTSALLAPAQLLLLFLGAVVYFVPSALAVYRGCEATAWICTVNVLFGWTIIGWFAALGWAAGGKIHPRSSTIVPPPQHPITGH